MLPLIMVRYDHRGEGTDTVEAYAAGAYAAMEDTARVMAHKGIKKFFVKRFIK